MPKKAAAKRKKVEEEEEEEDVNISDEEDVELKPKKKPAAKAAAKSKGKRKVEEVDEEAEDAEGDEEEGKKLPKISQQDTKNATTTIEKALEEAKGSKTLKEILTITPSVSSSASSSSLKDMLSSAFEPHFDEIADAILNRSVLFVGGLPHRILELEFYCNGHQHVDLFAHGNARQKKRAEWYFHMTGKGYKGGSYKGLDVTFGDDECYGGILLRTIQPLFGEFQAIEGPSLLVDHVLRTTNSKGVVELVSKFDMFAELRDPSKTDHPLFFVHSETGIEKIDKHPVYKGARVGLSMKTFQDTKEVYVGKYYRYMVMPEKIKKGRPYLVSSLHQQGRSAQEIAEITKSTKASIEKTINKFKSGAAKDFKLYCNKNLKSDEISEMLGSCSTFSYPVA